MITSFVFATLVLTVSGASWTYIDSNVGAYGPSLPFPNSQFKFKLISAQTSNMVAVLEIEVLNGSPGNHLHTREDEYFNVLEGQVQFFVNGTQFCAKPGDYIYIPRYVSQTFRVSNPTFTKKRVRMELVMFPAGGESFFEDMAISFMQGQTNNSTITDMIVKKYGFQFLTPIEWEDMGCFDD
jgi:mannose-6-phosphate isomerase-like protein (cupin superfamily)